MFLNLFAYTGSFTVYAAAGARRSVTVDMSKPTRRGADATWCTNGLDEQQRHSFVQADVFGFIERMRRARCRFDLIVLDPPSFSNSKRMETTFDVQRDQLRLLGATLDLLAPGAANCFFSTNRQGFQATPGGANTRSSKRSAHRRFPRTSSGIHRIAAG